MTDNRLNIALVGNPNVGKTTLFNRLTGLKQRVGNYPGVTVEKKTGEISLNEKYSANLIDLPGTYSLAASSKDEHVVVDALLGNIGDVTLPDLIICVVDASNLHRNLFLASQLAELEIPIIIALNQSDVIEKLGISINTKLLRQRVGVPVVFTTASKGEGTEELKTAAIESYEGSLKMNRIAWPKSITESISKIQSTVKEKFDRTLSYIEAQRILFDNHSVIADSLGWNDKDRIKALTVHRDAISKEGLNPTVAESVLQYRHLGSVLSNVVAQPDKQIKRRSESIDALLTHRVWGLVIFAGLMWMVFQSVYTWAGPMMDLIESATAFVQDAVSPLFDTMPTLQSLVVDGLIAGVGGVLIFLPQILVLFLFIGILEDTGYMARAAFLMDRVFSWCGLNGKSFVPLLSSYACAIPGIMAARTIQDNKARLTTILVAPLMSCSARLPVYILLIGAFIEPIYGTTVASTVLFLMHFLGLAIAIPIALAFNKFLFKTQPQNFLLEMPAYHVPQVKDLFWRMWERGREFVTTAGSVIVAFSIIIWAMLYFPHNTNVETETTAQFVKQKAKAISQSPVYIQQELENNQSEFSIELNNTIASAYIEQSYMGRIGKTIQPVFAPAGFDWKITVGLLSSFPAREIIVATLGIIYNLGSDTDEESEGLRSIMKKAVWEEGPRKGSPIFTIPVVASIMVFFALCMQCGATVSVIAKESNWKWATFSFVYMTLLAWVASVACYQVGTALFT